MPSTIVTVPVKLHGASWQPNQNCMQPLTALDALFEAPFPSYQALDKHAEDGELPLLAWAEIDDENYEGMREMLASRMDRDVVRRVGECANQRGGVQAMRGVYYTFLFALSVLSFHLGFTRSQWVHLKHQVVTPIQFTWDGVGRWQA